MRIMVLVKGDAESESGKLPSEEMLVAMGKFNDEMIKAGVMVSGEGLHPSSKGARISFSNGKVKVTDGPFAEAKELVAGYWVLNVKSKAEAIDWLKRAPFETGELELRPLFEAEDFGPSIKTDAGREVLAAEAKHRANATK